MSYGRSPRFEPINQVHEPTIEVKKPTISPIASIVGETNMILVWTGLAILIFIVCVIFYVAFNPSVDDTDSDEVVCELINNTIYTKPPA